MVDNRGSYFGVYPNLRQNRCLPKKYVCEHMRGVSIAEELVVKTENELVIKYVQWLPSRFWDTQFLLTAVRKWVGMAQGVSTHQHHGCVSLSIFVAVDFRGNLSLFSGDPSSSTSVDFLWRPAENAHIFISSPF